VKKIEAVYPMRAIRMGQTIPPTLEQVAIAVRERWGLRCTAGHLSDIERGDQPASQRLLAALAIYYDVPRTVMNHAFATTRARYLKQNVNGG